jgi:hypothetical protein
MAGVTGNGSVYYADVDVPMSPKWIYTGFTDAVDIAGSYGQLYKVNTTNLCQLPCPAGTTDQYTAWNIPTGTCFDSAGMAYRRQITNQAVCPVGSITNPNVTMFTQGQITSFPYASTQGSTYSTGVNTISVDDDGTLIGVTGNNIYKHTSPSSSATNPFPTAGGLGAISGGNWFQVGQDSNLYYWRAGSTSSVKVNPPGVAALTQVSYDGSVCVLQNDGTLWCADTNIGTPTMNWKQQGSKKLSQISLKGGRLVGIGFGADRGIYYSNTYQSPTWTTVPTQEYSAAGAAINGPLSFAKVIMFYPTLDARRKRFAVSGDTCGQDEEKIGAFCYAPCASGRAALGTQCPFRRKHTDPIAACPSGEYINGSCYQPCPDSSTTAQGELCVGNVVVKNLTGKLPSTPASYSCGDGTVGARYIRIRPTTIPAVQNNKLCISKVTVKDKDGNVLSLLSGMPGIKSTIGSISGTYIRAGFTTGGLGSIPIRSTQTVTTPGAGSSTASSMLYIGEEGGFTIMIADDTAGTAKYYSGAASAWTSVYWTNGTSAGNRASGYYVLHLHANPVTSTATDGTCVDTPLGGGSCPGAWSTYLSSTKYDAEGDGGRASRMTKTYWDLDLGDVQQIRTIEFTGCNYIPPTGATATAVDSTAVSQPKADQITGMRIQLLESQNLATTEPIVERTLGPELRQVLTFNYLVKEPGIDDTCYDACPKINGVQSVDGGEQTCIAASGGMTSRSITTPLKLPPPVCSLPTNADGTPYTMAAEKSDHTPWTIGNWIINPITPTQVLSCDVLPGSTLMPLQNDINVPITGKSSPAKITYTLQDPNNVPYTAKDPAAPYKCVIMSNSMCASYGNFVLRGGLCVRADIAYPEMNDDVNPNASWAPAGYAPDINGTAQACKGNDDIVTIPGGGKWCFARCPDGYSRNSTGGVCSRNGGDPTWGRGWWGNADGKIGGAYRYKYGWQGWQTLKDLMLGRPTVSTPPNSSVSSSDDFKIPLIRNDKSIIVDPQTFPAQCKCLNADGTVNTQAYLYNNTCVKCANPTELFYPKGTISSDFAWGNEEKNKFLSIYNDAVTRPIDQKPFSSLNDAKTLCEIDSFCTGITRSYDANGTPYYYLRAGTILKGTRPMASGSSIPSAIAGSSAGSTAPTWDSSWVKGAKGSTKITVGLRKGTNYSTVDIPTAFADDYLSPVSRGSSVFSIIPSTVTDLVNSMTNDVLQTASAWASFQNSVQNPNTYYQLVGIERQLQATSKPPDNGICVAPCDSAHSLHEAIQMIYDDVAKLYVLYGTTCHDATESVISKPSIPAIYTPQIGADCAAGYDLTTGGSCLQECNSNSIDNGSTCAGNGVRRPSIAPTLSCPSGLTLVGGTCLHPCGTGYIDDGDYCKPLANTVAVPSSINCVKTAYTYSTKYQGSGSATTVNKWLCDSDYDQYTLLQGPPGVVGSAYVNPNDIVCYADDVSSGMYYCQTVTEARNEVPNTERVDYSTSCDSMTKAYLDLNDNLTTLLSAQTTAQTASAQTAAIQITLQGIIQQLCGASGSSGSSSLSMCNTLRTQLAALSSNINSGSGAISGVLSPISVATSSRDNLITLLHTMKCCPAGQTQYPWC